MNDDELKEAIEVMTQAMTDNPKLRDTQGPVPVHLSEEITIPVPRILFWRFLIAKFLATDQRGHFWFTDKAGTWLLLQRMTMMLSELANCCECEQLAKLDDRYRCQNCRE